MNDSETIAQRRLERLTWLLVGVGILLRVWQLAGNASLFLDELALARNIIERGYRDLLRPLSYGQVAPPGFLLVERFMWSLFHTDLALRVIPFLCSIASLFLMRAVARRVLSEVGVLLAMGALAISPLMITYAAEVKQYSSMVAISLAMLVLSLRVLDASLPRTRDYAVIGGAGILAMWFSSPAIVSLTGIGAALTLLAIEGSLPHRRRVLLCVVAPWAAGALALSITARRSVSPETMAYMQEFWEKGFLPQPLTLGASVWLWRALTGFYDTGEGLGFPFAGAYAALALVGFVLLWRRRRDIALLLIAPVVVALGVAAVQMFPFKGRLVLYLTPVFVILAVEAVARAAEWLRPRSAHAALAVVLLAAAGPATRIVQYPPVYRMQRTHRLLEQLNARRRPEDVVFAWYRAEPHVHWYGPAYGLAERDILDGGCHLTAPRRFLTDIDRLRGRSRAWILMVGGFAPEARMAIGYANTIGTRLEYIAVPGTVPGFGPMEASLYDFSDTSKLTQSTAATYPVTLPANPPSAIMGCALGPFGPRVVSDRYVPAAP